MGQPFTKLALSGGGIWLLAQLGALEFINERKLINNLQGMIGSSAGSIIVCLLACGYSITEIITIIKKINFLDFLDKENNENDNENMSKHWGLFEGKRFQLYIDKLIQIKTGHANLTFKQLYDLNKSELVIIVTNFSLQKTEYFHHSNFPNYKISKAVRASISIPTFFYPLYSHISDDKEKDILIDGGMTNNFGISIFDEMEYFKKNPIFGKTMGIITRGSPNLLQKRVFPKDIISFDTILVQLLIRNISKISVPEKYIMNVVEINDIPISPINFNLNEKQSKDLFLMGYEAAKQKFY